MECNIIRKSSGFKDLKNDWERIEKTSQNLTYFSTFNYCYTWFKHLNTIDEKLFIVTVIHNDKIVGIAPFHVRNIKGKLLKKRALQFISKGDYSDLLIDENTDIKPSNIISKIFDAIHDNEKEWDEINLTHISQNSLLTHYLLQRKYNKNLEYLVENPFIDFSKYQDYNSYSKEFSPKK